MAHDGLTTTSARSLGLVERLPVRRIILTILTVAVVTFVAVGTYKTLTLSGADHLGWAFWANLLVIGLALGAVYALIALGYTLVYGILRMINFAHGEVFMWGAFGSYFFATAYAKSGFLNSNPWASLAILFVSAIAISTGVAVLLERVAYRPLRNAPRLVPLITAIGASLFLQNTAQGFFGAQTRGYPRPSILDGTITKWGVSFDKIDPIVIVTSIVVMVALEVFVKRTKTGKSMRAVAQDREIASLMGIDVDRVIVTTFIIGGMLAGIAGVLFALTFGQVGATMGFLPGHRRLHGGGPRRHRQHPGRGDRRLHLGRRRVGRPVPPPHRLQRALAVRAARRGDVLDPRARADLPSRGHPRDRRGGEGLMGVGVRSAVRVGIIAGITVWYLALVGMMERLTTLIVVGRISMVAVLIFLPPAVGGWVVSRPRVVAGERRETSMRSAVSLGAATGLAGGILVSAGYALVNILGVETVRQVFISVTPALMELLHFHMGPVAERWPSWGG